MEESHVKCQKLGAEKGLSPCAGRAVLRVTVVSASCYMESCAYLKSIDQTCRQWASTRGSVLITCLLWELLSAGTEGCGCQH